MKFFRDLNPKKLFKLCSLILITKVHYRCYGWIMKISQRIGRAFGLNVAYKYQVYGVEVV